MSRLLASAVLAIGAGGCSGDEKPAAVSDSLVTTTSSPGTPEQARVWLLRGCALLGLGRVEEAAAAFESSVAISFDPGLQLLLSSIESGSVPQVEDIEMCTT